MTARKDISIRPAVAADLSDIENCARLAYARYVDRIGREPAPMVADFARALESDQVWVAHSHNQFAGYVVCYECDGHMQLENIAVLPVYAGSGFGKALIDHVEHRARTQGLKAVALYTNIKMTENLTMYPALGYHETGRRHEDGFDRVYFRKLV